MKFLHIIIKQRAAIRFLCLTPILLYGACTSQPNDENERSLSLGLIPETIDQRDEEAFLDRMLSNMSLEAKVAQMVQAEIKYITPQQVKKYGVGSVLNGGGSFPASNKQASIDDWRSLAKRYHEMSVNSDKSPLPIPILWGTDAVHGHNNVFRATIFPHNIGLGAANNPSLTREIFSATAADVRATGIKWVFSPTVAVARDPRWGRTYESFSEDPMIVSRLAVEAIVGLQGISVSQIADPDKVIATSKHFIGDGGTSDGIDQGNTKLSEEQLLDIHGQSFLAALDAGSQTVMASFNSWNSNKVHGSRYLLTDVLKNRFQFDGFVIGDWNGHAQIPGCSKGSCPQAINAGVDMLMAPEDWEALIKNTIEQVKSGVIASERIDDAVRRILRVKYRAGLFTEQHKIWLDDHKIASDSTRNLAREAVRESLVLLKNNRETLPLRPNSNILIIGKAADSISQQTGGWSLSWQGDGNTNQDFPNGSSILQGIKRMLSENDGLLTYDPTGAHTKNTSYLGNYDAAILVFGEEPYAEGAGDIPMLQLPSNQFEYLPLIRKLSRQNVPVVSILISGRPLSVASFVNHSDAFVAAWLPGTEGVGLADVLIGNEDKTPRHNFKGKLPFSWPESAKQSGINNYPHYKEEPMFSVGYGLNYQSQQQLGWLDELDAPVSHKLNPSSRLPLFIKKALAPWSLYVGSEENWGVAISGNRGATEDRKTVTVESSERSTQEDARRVSWGSGKQGQFYIQNEESVDLSELAENNGMLTFNLKVLTHPQGDVSLRMDCKYPCSGSIDVTEVLRSIPENTWESVSVDLSCFESQGANLKHINTPFLLATDNTLALEVSDIVIDTESNQSRHIPCPGSLSMISSEHF